MVLDNRDTILKLTEFLKLEKPFTFLRYGDGDFIAMYPSSVNRIIGANNKSYITKEVQTKLIESYSVDRDNYLVGTLNKIEHPRSMRKNVNFGLVDRVVPIHPSTQYSSIGIQEAFLDFPDLFINFCSLLNKKKSVYINSYFDSKVEGYIGKVVKFIQVTETNATKQHEEVLNQFNLLELDSFDHIILSCGQLARVLGKDLYDKFPTKTIIDMGSTSDMFALQSKLLAKQKIKRSHIINSKTLILDRIKLYESVLHENNKGV
jgi:hypothetical protein